MKHLGVDQGFYVVKRIDMKSILITLLFYTFSCSNPTEKGITKQIILPSENVDRTSKPDTFIPIDVKEVNPALVSDLVDNLAENHDISNDVSSEVEENQELAPIPEASPILEETTPENSTDNIIITKPETPQSVSDIELPVDAEEDVALIEEIVDQSGSVTTTPTACPKPKENTKIIDSSESINDIVLIAKPDHSLFNDLLSSYVSTSGVVNYKGLKSVESKLNAYLENLDANAPSDSWSKHEQLAYWMNAYNAFTIKLILNNYPVNQITDLHGGKPWDQKWISLGGKTYSLNDIEHSIIRPRFKDPRIHFAVNCAAKSCPPLLNKAYTGENVDSELTKVTRAFVNSSSNKLSSSSIQLSKIFEWYAEDFGNLIEFLNQYATEKVNSNAKIGYLPYNWDLNED